MRSDRVRPNGVLAKQARVTKYKSAHAYAQHNRELDPKVAKRVEEGEVVSLDSLKVYAQGLGLDFEHLLWPEVAEEISNRGEPLEITVKPIEVSAPTANFGRLPDDKHLAWLDNPNETAELSIDGYSWIREPYSITSRELRFSEFWDLSRSGHADEPPRDHDRFFYYSFPPGRTQAAWNLDALKPNETLREDLYALDELLTNYDLQLRKESTVTFQALSGDKEAKIHVPNTFFDRSLRGNLDRLSDRAIVEDKYLEILDKHQVKVFGFLFKTHEFHCEEYEKYADGGWFNECIDGDLVLESDFLRDSSGIIHPDKPSDVLIGRAYSLPYFCMLDDEITEVTFSGFRLSFAKQDEGRLVHYEFDPFPF